MEQPKPRPVTIRDVAALAGVSAGTASKALNNQGQLRQETRDRVLAAAKGLKFRPNETARSLGSERTFTVGLLTTDSIGRFSIPVLLGAEDALAAGTILVFLCDTREDPIRERHYVETLLSRRVDGFIVTGRRSDPRTPLAVDVPVPVVYALTPSSDPADCSVVADDEQAGRLAGEHLIATGRSAIAHITGPASFDAVGNRERGLRTALSSSGLSLVGPGVLYGEWSEAWGRRAAQILLRSGAQFDGVYCGSDQIARGAAEVLAASGRAVPDDVALVGTDNWDILVEGRTPTLTTIDLNLHEVGRRAAQRLLAAIDGEPTQGLETCPSRLVMRESTELQRVRD
ncbi:LacI family DNA-binding transcriptional regulator [Actinospica sp. MGRD01-02]|uniref:LacI family DNA-binding transcriptional regulator n=1 Tax=Actinospica acidithermotolerans TaxID=2828514 RepID=A0A941IHF5_9ACTN|nr:LacI family DNA-binding transcriptional regulator [Actinospica acidithermotolerans]MBR7825133.1 LacI family DNA-binding transcriptional regulator [Actinospica acidithermotolerans]